MSQTRDDRRSTPPGPHRPHDSPWRRAWARRGPPPRATSMAGWALLPLRLFLGGTFVFAGMQKIANPGFFDRSNPTSIQSQLASAARISPIHGLVAHLEPHAVALGVVMALAEIAVGAGTLAGLWTRVAAAGGMLVSFGLFLTVSFHSSPYYTGSDIVFVFAWTPLLVAGAGGVLSVDAWARDRARARSGVGPATTVPVSFGVVQRVCGAYDAGACRAMSGAPCEPVPCPYLAQSPGPTSTAGPDIDRRTFAQQGVFAAALAAVALAGTGLVAGLGRLGGKSNGSGAPAPSPSTSPTSGPTGATATGSGSTPGSSVPTTTPVSKPVGTRIGAAASVPVGGSATFQDPRSGDPSIVVQPAAGTFAAFDAVCPHEGCIVAYSSPDGKFICPCHGSEFNGKSGAVVRGPAPRGLGRIPVEESGGELYVT